MSSVDRLSPAPFSTLQARRICLIKTSSLGDVVQALPVFAALRDRFPAAHITWIVNSGYASLLRPIDEIDEVIEFDRERYRQTGAWGWRPFATFLKTLRKQHFDLAIDLQGLFRSGAMCWATGADKRIGLASAREGAGLFYTDVVDDCHGASRLAVDRYWRVAELFGVGHVAKRFPLNLSAEEHAWASQSLAGLRRPILAINGGARWETKRWPAERFAEGAKSALGMGAGSIVLVGGPGEEPIAEEIAGRLAGARNLCGKTSLRHLAAALSQCDLLLTNDTGPMHLAAAVGLPTVSLFTCTAPERAAPYGEGHRMLQTEVACKASYLKTCDRMECMNDLTTDKLLPILSDALGDVAPVPGYSIAPTDDQTGNRAA